MKDQAHLVCSRLGTRGAVSGQVSLPGFDMVFSPSALAIVSFVKGFTTPADQTGDNEACVPSPRSDIDASDDAFDAGPGGGGIINLLEAADLVALACLKALGSALFQVNYMVKQGRVGSHAKHEVHALSATQVQGLQRPVMRIAPQQDFDAGPVSTNLADQTA